jgi:hypothetical protein
LDQVTVPAEHIPHFGEPDEVSSERE